MTRNEVLVEIPREHRTDAELSEEIARVVEACGPFVCATITSDAIILRFPRGQQVQAVA